MIKSSTEQQAEEMSSGKGLSVAFQGERGAFSDEAVNIYFGEEAEPFPCRSFAEVFRAVAAGEVEYGLVPV